MRTIQVNTSQVTYPDATVFTGDNIFISVSDATYPVGAEISVTNIATLQTKTLVYVSELKNLTFDIRDTVKMLHAEGGSTLNIKVKVYNDMFYTGTFAFNVQTLDGRSMPQRSHGSARTFYIYSPDELYKFYMFLAGSGSLYVNGTSIPVVSGGRNTFNLQQMVISTGEHSLCYYMGVKSGGSGAPDQSTRVEITDVEPWTVSAVVSLNYHDMDPEPSEQIKGGGVWSDSKMDLAKYCSRLVYEDHCDDFDFLELSYWDTDGCFRYLGGKIISETTETSKENFTGVRHSVYRDISQKYINESDGKVKVAFEDLRRDSYYSDILLSDHVYFRNYNGDWLPCSIVDSKITVKSDEYSDLELEVELYRQ